MTDGYGSSSTLGLVTCGPQLEIALDADTVSCPTVLRLSGIRRRSALVMAAIDLAFEDAQLERGELGLVLITRGPGSFTGIRSGIATALGLAAGGGTPVMAFSSLLAQAARSRSEVRVWTAQPARKGEVYAQHFECVRDHLPKALSPIKILTMDKIGEIGPWIAPDGLDLSGAERVEDLCSAAQALLRLRKLGAVSDPVEPLYVEGPPIHKKKP